MFLNGDDSPLILNTKDVLMPKPSANRPFFTWMLSALIAAPIAFGMMVHARLAHAAPADTLKISEAVVAPTRPGQPTGAAFLMIENVGKDADQLIGISVGTEIATRAELHTMKHENGMMMMREVPGFTIAAGKTLALKPGGDHLMLIGIQKPLVEGQQIPATLIFEKAGKVSINLLVRKPSAPKGAMHEHHKH